MNQEQRRKLYEKGFNDGVDSLESFYIEALYGAAALAAHREFGFDQEKCFQLLNCINDIITNNFTSQDVIHDAWKECGLKVVFTEGKLDTFEPFEKVVDEVSHS